MGRKARIVMSEGEKKLCDLMMVKETPLVAEELGVKSHTIYQTFYKLRKRIEEAQTLVNQANRYKQMSPRLRRLLTKGKLLKKNVS